MRARRVLPLMVARLLAAAALPAGALLPVGVVPPAVAEVGPPRVSTDPAGAHVELDRRGAWVEIRDAAPGGAGGSRGGSGANAACVRRWVRAAVPRYPNFYGDDGRRPRNQAMPPAPTPEHRAYHVFCGGRYLDSVWLLPSQFSGRPSAALLRAIAERLARDLPYPAAGIGANPAWRGLTGLESWFWITGYGTATIRESVRAFGVVVEVEAQPDTVRWDFGDGTAPVAGGLGQAGGVRSDVVHTYERRSTSAFTVRADLTLTVRYRVDGGAWQPLPAVGRAATAAYPVTESRATLVAPR